MTTETALKALMTAAIGDPRREPELLRAMLSARLYVHLPRSDDSGRMRLLMFTRPDGITVIPFFSDADEAWAAAGTGARVAAVLGRELFEATRGATLMLDPNDVSMTLYPEEVSGLLDLGQAIIAPFAAEGPDLELLPLPDGDRWLLDHLAASIAGLEGVERLHLVQARQAGSSGGPDRYLAIAAVTPSAAERVARALAVALFRAPSVPELPLDLSTYSPDDAPPTPANTGLPELPTRAINAFAGDAGGA